MFLWLWLRLAHCSRYFSFRFVDLFFKIATWHLASKIINSWCARSWKAGFSFSLFSRKKTNKLNKLSFFKKQKFQFIRILIKWICWDCIPPRLWNKSAHFVLPCNDLYENRLYCFGCALWITDKTMFLHLVIPTCNSFHAWVFSALIEWWIYFF